MNTIIFTNDEEYADYLVSSNKRISKYVFYHYLINHRVTEHILYDLELCEGLDVEVIIVVLYDNIEVLEYAKNKLKQSKYLFNIGGGYDESN